MQMRGSIVKRNTGYSIVVDIGHDANTNKRKQKWFGGFKSEVEAEKALPKILIKAQKGLLVQNNNSNFEDFIVEWLKGHALKQNLAATTLDGYENIVNKHVVPELGKLKLQKIKPYNIQNYFDLKFKTLSATTLDQHYIVLNKAFGYAKKMGYIEENPCPNTERPKQKHTETKVYNIEECKLLLDKIYDNKALYIPVTLALLLGLRRGEVLGLRWCDIDFANKEISIMQTIQRVNSVFIFKEPKTVKSKRVLAVTDDILELLKGHIKYQKLLKLQSGGRWKNEHGLVCTRSEGEPFTPHCISDQFKIFLENNGLPHIRFHDLRHINATLMLTAGVQSKVAGDRLGHSKTKITLDLYSHVLKQVDRSAAEKIKEVLSR
jgi:integrase